MSSYNKYFLWNVVFYSHIFYSHYYIIILCSWGQTHWLSQDMPSLPPLRGWLSTMFPESWSRVKNSYTFSLVFECLSPSMSSSQSSPSTRELPYLPYLLKHGPSVEFSKITSLKSLRLRKLLDKSALAYWALLGPSGSFIVQFYWPYLALLSLT